MKLPKSIIERLYRKVVHSESGCWIWGGARNSGGYGHLTINGVTKTANRVSWEEHNGPIPEGMYVLHRCDVRACINPKHLFLGSAKDNTHDAISKGRLNKVGEAHHNSKLTQAQVLEIRQNSKSHEDIAKEFGISKSHVSSIKNFQRWSCK